MGHLDVRVWGPPGGLHRCTRDPRICPCPQGLGLGWWVPQPHPDPRAWTLLGRTCARVVDGEDDAAAQAHALGVDDAGADQGGDGGVHGRALLLQDGSARHGGARRGLASGPGLPLGSRSWPSPGTNAGGPSVATKPSETGPGGPSRPAPPAGAQDSAGGGRPCCGHGPLPRTRCFSAGRVLPWPLFPGPPSSTGSSVPGGARPGPAPQPLPAVPGPRRGNYHAPCHGGHMSSNPCQAGLFQVIPGSFSAIRARGSG